MIDHILITESSDASDALDAVGGAKRRLFKAGCAFFVSDIYSHPQPSHNSTLNKDAVEWPSNRTGDTEDRLSHNRYNRIQHHPKCLPLWQRGFLPLG